jgi:hypothetical protein
MLFLQNNHGINDVDGHFPWCTIPWIVYVERIVSTMFSKLFWGIKYIFDPLISVLNKYNLQNYLHTRR